MRSELQVLTIRGENVGYLVPLGDRLSFFTVRADLKHLDGRMFASTQDASSTVSWSLARRSLDTRRPPGGGTGRQAEAAVREFGDGTAADPS